MSDTQRQLPPEDEAISKCRKAQDERAMELRYLTIRIQAMAAIGGQGAIDSLDEDLIHAYFSQIEDLAAEANTIVLEIFDQRHNISGGPNDGCPAAPLGSSRPAGSAASRRADIR
ncbi:hypothetical protein PTE30175_03182 [Pandoraea terrae]|uniref:Uncharacterized protein n=1 Tax=Pandoraea terrae TaxID=1537710 RepID=A0A5E4WJ17_9BURK|nr:hypothetical protein [Pandoraea terrae]VVE23560.1 hypothetical protein PTE30175_03182 [Pandoraea terrae]